MDDFRNEFFPSLEEFMHLGKVGNGLLKQRFGPDSMKKIFYVCCAMAKENPMVFYHNPNDRIMAKAQEKLNSSKDKNDIYYTINLH